MKIKLCDDLMTREVRFDVKDIQSLASGTQSINSSAVIQQLVADEVSAKLRRGISPGNVVLELESDIEKGTITIQGALAQISN